MALIESNKPIVVTRIGVGSFPIVTAGGQDFGVDQLVGAELVGSEYISTKEITILGKTFC